MQQRRQWPRLGLLAHAVGVPVGGLLLLSVGKPAGALHPHPRQFGPDHNSAGSVHCGALVQTETVEAWTHPRGLVHPTAQP